MFLGKPPLGKTDEFPENFRRGGGGKFPILKMFLQFFCIRNCSFGNEKIAIYFPKKGHGGGGKGRSEIFRKFSRFAERRLP